MRDSGFLVINAMLAGLMMRNICPVLGWVMFGVNAFLLLLLLLMVCDGTKR